jgi:hypothetical protein
MNSSEKTLVYLSTIFIDISLIWILLNAKLNNYDTIFICTALFFHLLFYIGLFFNNRTLLDICHVMIVIAILCAVFIQNKILISLLLTLIIYIYITWFIFDNRCILNTSKQNKTSRIYEITGFTSSNLYNIVIIILVFKLANIIQ